MSKSSVLCTSLEKFKSQDMLSSIRILFRKVLSFKQRKVLSLLCFQLFVLILFNL
jgi:hypothetical protein